MDVERTVFIIGSGRSGTTVLYHILATHPEVAWFSYWSNRFPGSPGWVRLHRLLDAPVLGTRLRKGIITRSWATRKLGLMPSEGEEIYRTYCGFRDDVRSTEEDLDPSMERRLRSIIESHLELTRKPRFVNKRTSNTQRLALMNRMFPDACYVHLIRDGRAVANSFMNVDWWPDHTIWWSRDTPSDWERQGRTPIELCALHWKHNVEEILATKDVLANYLEVRYERLVRDSRAEIHRIIDFCDLPKGAAFEERIPEALPDMDRKWRSALSDDDLSIIENAAGDLL
ncbi:MAG: sulfotransferase, partial [Thermoplasmata archaeon]|nr:sulfotransferase [Thermoplasmata archaeon]